MISPNPVKYDFIRFRRNLWIAMMLLISGITALALYFAQRNAAVTVERELQQDFHAALQTLHVAEVARLDALAERCRTLARSVRIRAAIEESDVADLYENARIELRDILEGAGPASRDDAAPLLKAAFFLFVDAKGAVLPPPEALELGISQAMERQIEMPRVPTEQQIGYIVFATQDGKDKISEIIATPIAATDSDRQGVREIGMIVLGFKPAGLGGVHVESGLRSGIYVRGRLDLPALDRPIPELQRAVARAVSDRTPLEKSFSLTIKGIPRLVFCKLLNPGSVFPPAYEICTYPLASSLERQRLIRWQIVALGGFVLLAGLIASHFIAIRLSRPVEKLAFDSAENRIQRQKAEAVLETTHEELQRSTRFSADASHQLKTPVTILRVALEELLARENLPPEVRSGLSSLVHQTFRLTGIIEDLLLLSRMDAGRLELQFTTVDLVRLIEGWLDDLETAPDSSRFTVETELPETLLIAGEKRYTDLILQNLLENSKKYNQPGGCIRVKARGEGEWAVVNIGNTGRGIPSQMREHIFKRFHRGNLAGVPGHGLGLNLARELARIHGGDLRLAASDTSWTEFELRFRLAKPASAGLLSCAYAP